MTFNVNIFKCLIFLGKILSKKLAAPAYLTVLKEERDLFVLLQIIYFGKGLRSLLEKDTTIQFFQV